MGDRVELVAAEAVTALLDQLRASIAPFEGFDAAIMAGGASIAMSTPDSVRVLLAGHRTQMGAEVLVVWPMEREAASMAYDDFCAHYDDLWYPSSDDLWVVSMDARRVLLFDHEESVVLVDLR
jgi:hypothetical protein